MEIQIYFKMTKTFDHFMTINVDWVKYDAKSNKVFYIECGHKDGCFMDADNIKYIKLNGKEITLLDA